MQVLEQDEDTRGKGELFRYGGLTLRSIASPDSSCLDIYVRGSICASDFKPCSWTFGSNEDRDEYYDTVKALIQAYNASLGTEQGCMREIVE